MQKLPVSIACDQEAGVLERVEGSPMPVVRVFGWFSARKLPSALLDTTNRRQVAPLVVSRIHRPDVLADKKIDQPFCGFRMDFLLDLDEQPTALSIGEKVVYNFPEVPRYAQMDPHYRNFFTQEHVMGRSSVYGSGPPADVAAEFKAFASVASGRVLDFGCGNGDLISHLRNQGIDAVGLELDEHRIRSALKFDAREHVNFYPGGIPLPFSDESFDWIVSTEVIEHVSDISHYVSEFSRVLKPGGKLLITTPDITSIPSSFPTGCVPWHLLEATHINFFTPQSVVRLFSPHFDIDATYCLGSNRVNGYFVPGSIGAIFSRRAATAELE